MTNEELLKVIEEAKASKVTALNLSMKGLTALPPEIGRLTNLTKLDLWNNHLTILPPEIGQLTNLTELNLFGNQLTALPPEIGQLTNLIKLDLWRNQLTALPREIGKLTSLTKLNLWGNQLTALPSEIIQLTNLKKFNLNSNPLISPPHEIIEQGLEAIHQYFISLQTGERPLNEVKVLLVGDGAAGKTSLVKQLLGEAFDQQEDTTHGISIRGWGVGAGGQPVKVNIWDFGGQEIMHATHQFFLSKRSLYVLVLDGRKDERAEYWLQHIESFGGDSPVLVVLNKQDSNPGFDINRPFLREKYPGIRRFFRTSCADGRGIAQFKETLIEELGKMPMVGIRWPQTWFAVKQRIEELGRPYISCEEYAGICKEAGIAEEENRKTLISFLHDLGAAVHFDDYVLNAMHVLDPVWVTQAVYKIITAKEMADSNGRLHLASLTEILRHEEGEKCSWPVNTHVFILELMKKFQLCWGIGEHAVLLPQILPVAEPEFAFDYSGALGFVLHYQDFLPPSIFPRFMVKVHQSIKPGLCWRTGVVLRDKDSGTEAVVKADTEARRIYLWVNGPRRKEYLSFLWFSLREINSGFEKLNVSERIPMPDDPQVTADYQTLLDCVQDGIERYRPDGAKRSYNVKELLGLVEPTGQDEQLALLQMIKTQLDGKESNIDFANSLFMLKPNIAGVGFNLNELFTRVLGKKRQR